jgi:acetolactate synthase regulatory subunit
MTQPLIPGQLVKLVDIAPDEEFLFDLQFAYTMDEYSMLLTVENRGVFVKLISEETDGFWNIEFNINGPRRIEGLSDKYLCPI